VKRDFSAVVADIKNGKGPRLLMLFGDDLQVQQACKAVVELLVPENQRGFNLERLDGRATTWNQIEASLMTPPFFPGKKVIWVESVPYFVTREQKGELSEKILRLWSDGLREEASKALMDLLVVEGWTQERWEELGLAPSGPLLELLGVDGQETRGDAEALFVYCKSRELDFNARKAAGGHRLFELLDRGLPEWDFLLLTALQVDRRSRLYKRFEELGAALYVGPERDRYGKISRESLLEFINQRLRQAGKTLEPRAREMILTRSGDHLRALDQELEKLFLYAGERPTISGQDVDAVFVDQGEGWIFDLTRAVGERDSAAALAHLARLVAQGEHPLRLLATLAGEIRKLLAARQLIDGELRAAWKSGMSYPEFQQRVLPQGTPLLTRNAYGDYMCFERADHFTLSELRMHMEGIFDTDLRLKSSGGDPRLVMERLLLGMCRRPRGKRIGELKAAT
jgi:DNA polymerase III subunit delta